MRGAGRDGDAGFTLIELLVVLAVLSLAVGLVLARGPMRSSTVDLRAAARTMAADMRSTRARAIDGDRALLFTLDAVHADYGVKNGARHPLPRGMAVGSSGAVPAQVLFRPDGSASGGVLVLMEGDRRIEVATDWLTGAVMVR